MRITEMSRSRKIQAGRQIAKTLLPSENAIDTSIVAGANLLIAIVQGRLDAGVAAEVGHDAYLSAAAGIAALTDARNHVITCHQHLAATRESMQFSEQDLGCSITKLRSTAAVETAIVEPAVRIEAA